MTAKPLASTDDQPPNVKRSDDPSQLAGVLLAPRFEQKQCANELVGQTLLVLVNVVGFFTGTCKDYEVGPEWNCGKSFLGSMFLPQLIAIVGIGWPFWNQVGQ